MDLNLILISNLILSAIIFIYTMPEAGEIRRITDKLRSRLKGGLLLFIDWLSNTKYSSNMEQIWPAIKNIFPSTCLEILCRGKQIFFFFENGLAFISGLGMEGHWYYLKSTMGERQSLDDYISNINYRKFCLHFGKCIEQNGVIWSISDTEIWYDDMLSYGNFTITIWANAFNKMKELGPDLLAATKPLNNINPIIQQSLPSEFFQQATLQDFISAIRSSRRSQMLLCVFLLKHQEYFSGIGNYLKSEILYRAHLHPNRILGSLFDHEIELLFSTCLITITQAYECGGLTHGTFLDPDMEKGTFSVYVYNREGQHDQYGFLIKKINTNDGRSSYIVEEIQK
jgi:formamidopyrimidine-DNA glycosylase